MLKQAPHIITTWQLSSCGEDLFSEVNQQTTVILRTKLAVKNVGKV
jgi:hypothetical protein